MQQVGHHFASRIFGELHEFVDEFLAHHLLDDILVVIIAQRAAQFVIVHVRLVLAETPKASHFFSIQQLEFAFGVRPRDQMVVLIA